MTLTMGNTCMSPYADQEFSLPLVTSQRGPLLPMVHTEVGAYLELNNTGFLLNCGPSDAPTMVPFLVVTAINLVAGASPQRRAPGPLTY